MSEIPAHGGTGPASAPFPGPNGAAPALGEGLGPLDRSLVLVGLMGAGKSCIGKRLAAQIGLPFRDADREIEAAAGSTIAEIFARHGEPYFRDGERRVIQRLLADPVHVLATGGGAFIDPATRDLVKQRAISIWLRADLDLLVKRVSRRNDRPLLHNVDPRQRLAELIEQRYPIYAEADIVVDSADGPPEAIVAQVLTAVRRHLAAHKSASAGVSA